MSLRKRRNVVLLAVLHFLMLAAFLPGCKEGTKTSPVSALLTLTEQAEIDLSQQEDAIHTISGKVVSKNSSEKIDNVSVSLFFEKKLAGETRTTSDGTFYFAKLPPAIYDLSFSREAYANASYVIRIMEDGTLSPSNPEIELTTNATESVMATLEGNVFLSGTNQPLPNLNVELFLGSSTIPIKSSLTNSQGHFSFSDINAGTYTAKIGQHSIYNKIDQIFTVYGDGIVSPKLAMIVLNSQTNATYSISISGYVKAQNSESIPSFQVTLYSDHDVTNANKVNMVNDKDNPTYTTGEGKFFFENLSQPGIYFLVASAASFNTSEPFAVRILPDGTTSPASIEIPIIRKEDKINRCLVTGSITDGFSGGPIEYATIKVGGFNVATTDIKGKFEVDMLPGTYKIDISKFGYETLSSSFQVENIASMSLNYPLIHSLKAGYGSIAGRFVDVDSGDGVLNATIYLYKWVLSEKIYWDFTYISSSTYLPTGYQSKISKMELESENPILITKTGTSTSNLTPEYQGSFKLTHLEPATYLVYIDLSATAPSIINEPLDNFDTIASLTWRTVDKRQKDFVIYNLTVEAGNTTYWTNYEQAYK